MTVGARAGMVVGAAGNPGFFWKRQVCCWRWPLDSRFRGNDVGTAGMAVGDGGNLGFLEKAGLLLALAFGFPLSRE